MPDNNTTTETLAALDATHEGITALHEWINTHPGVKIRQAAGLFPLLFWLDHHSDLPAAVEILSADGDAVVLTREQNGTDMLRVSRHFGGGVTLAALGEISAVGEPTTRMVEVSDWTLPAEIDAIPEAGR